MSRDLRTRINGPHRLPRWRSLLALCLMVPLLIGGCPEFRDDVVSVFETAAQSALLGTDDQWTITNAVRVSLMDATIDVLFDQFRSDESR